MENRPVIFEYKQLPQFVGDMLRWRKKRDRAFSVRKETARLHRCSYALVSAVAAGKRRMTLDRVDDFGRILGLSPEEKGYLRRWLGEGVRAKHEIIAKVLPPTPKRKRGQNTLLSDWLNVYVKDLCRVKGFEPDPEVIYRMLGGIASVSQIKRSLNFLFREGYLRRTLDGRIVENDVLVTTTDEQLDQKVQKIHRRALEIAGKRIAQYPLAQRRESLVVMPLNEKSVLELKELLKEFYERTLQFAEDHPTDDEKLFQVILNLSPIGGAT